MFLEGPHIKNYQQAVKQEGSQNLGLRRGPWSCVCSADGWHCCCLLIKRGCGSENLAAGTDCCQGVRAWSELGTVLQRGPGPVKLHCALRMLTSKQSQPARPRSCCIRSCWRPTCQEVLWQRAWACCEGTARYPCQKSKPILLPAVGHSTQWPPLSLGLSSHLQGTQQTAAQMA